MKAERNIDFISLSLRDAPPPGHEKMGSLGTTYGKVSKGREEHSLVS